MRNRLYLRRNTIAAAGRPHPTLNVFGCGPRNHAYLRRNTPKYALVVGQPESRTRDSQFARIAFNGGLGPNADRQLSGRIPEKADAATGRLRDWSQPKFAVLEHRHE